MQYRTHGKKCGRLENTSEESQHPLLSFFSSPGVLSGLGKAQMLQISHTALLEPRVPQILLWQLFSRQSMLHFIHLK